MNKTLKLLSLSDLFILSGFGLISPILAIYINVNLGAGIFLAGLATTILLITRSVFQIIFSYKFNPKDRLWLLILGTAIIALVPFGYIFSQNIWHFLAVQFIYGIGASMAYPAWNSFFVCHQEEGKKGFQWSIYNSTVSIGAAISAAIGGLIAQATSFTVVFILTGILSLIGFLILFKLEKSILKRY